MTLLERLRQKLAAKIAERDQFLARIEGESRDMTADEKATFDGMSAEVRDQKTRLAGLEAEGDDDEDATSEDIPPVRSAKRGLRSQPIEGAPAIHTKKRRWSMLRAIRCSFGEEPLNGVEAEVHKEVVRRAGGRVFSGVAVPTGNDPEIRALMGLPEQRDGALTTVTGAGGIYTVPRGFIDLLRPNFALERLGATMLTDLKGPVGVTRQNAANSLQWVGESGSATPTNLGLDTVTLKPKLAIATSIITRQMMMQSSIDADQKTEEDLAKVCGIGMTAAVINGPGGAAPLGILNNPAITGSAANQAIALGANGGAFTYGTAVQMETNVSNANVGQGRLAYLTNPTIRGRLKQTYVGEAGYPLFVFSKGAAADQGEINAYPALVTTLVPNNLSKGTSNNLSAVIFANMQDILIGQWDTGLDLIVDIYTGKRSGYVEITMELAMDVQFAHYESFSVVQDATP